MWRTLSEYFTILRILLVILSISLGKFKILRLNLIGSEVYFTTKMMQNKW